MASFQPSTSGTQRPRPHARSSVGEEPAEQGARAVASRVTESEAPMRIVVVGAGYVGLVTAACLAHLGNEVTAVEVDATRVASLSAGRVPFFEPGLQPMVSAQLASGRLKFSAGLGAAIKTAELAFVAVGTPSGPDGAADLRALEAALAVIRVSARGQLGVAIKSTVPVGTHDRLKSWLESQPGAEICLLSNPEFLREGSAVQDFLAPDRILVGAACEKNAAPLRRAYSRLLEQGVPWLCMQPASAELGKYASNAMLAARISFMNEMAQIADATGADIEEVRSVVGSDARIGREFLRAGMGYGGSCFPKDVRALTHTARSHGLAAPLLNGVETANERQKRSLFEHMQRHFGGSTGLLGKRIALWGLAFKPGTDDLREAPSLVLLDQLTAAGALVSAYDPVAVPAARQLLGTPAGVRWCHDAQSALAGADALAIVTEWDEFRFADPASLLDSLACGVVFDGRNCVPADEWRDAGLILIQIGRAGHRPHAAPKPAPDAAPIRMAIELNSRHEAIASALPQE